MKSPSVYVDDEESENVTIELYQTVPLGTTTEDVDELKPASENGLLAFLSRCFCCCGCRRGQDFEPLTGHGH